MRLDPFGTRPHHGRALPGLPPTRERIADLARAVAAGTYRVDAEAVAEAMLRTVGDRAARPG